MATTGKQIQWEVVGTTGKKAKNASSNLSKNQKKMLKESMPRIEASPPLKEDSTMYDVFIEKESSKPGKENGRVQASGDANPKKATQKKKQTANKEKEHKKSPTDLQTAAKTIDVADLESVFARVQTTFPDNPSVWLKDLASVLNLKMDLVPEPDPCFQGKPHDYPLCVLPKPVSKMLLSIINQCSNKTLELFLEHCISCMITDGSKGMSSYGYRMFIQMVLHNKAGIIASNLPKYQDMIQINQNRLLRCLSVLWALGQAGIKQLGSGLRVWKDVMFPVLGMRNLATFAVEYLENLFALHKNLKSAYGALSSTEFLSLMDFIFKTQSSLSPNLQKRLKALWPKLKALAFGSPGSNQHQTLFPMLLARCTPNTNASLRGELLECMVECLSGDKHCFSVWRQLYTKNILGSSMLLSHLNENWEAVRQRLDTKLLRETVQTFNVTNGEMAAKEAKAIEGQRKCSSACKELLAKMTKSWFPWKPLLLLVLTLLGSLLAFDIYSSGTFANCRTRAFLADTGVLLFLEQVWQRIRVYSAKVILWLQENVPYYTRRLCEVAGPYLQLFWEKVYDLGVWIAEATAPQRAWLNQKIPLLLDWVNAKLPWLWASLSYYLGLVWGVILQYSIWLWDHVVVYANLASAWLLENVFTGSLSPENILTTTSSGLQVLQTYILAAFQWCQQLVSGPGSASKSS